MKSLLKSLIPRLTRPAINQLELASGRKFSHDETVSQKLLFEHYRTLAGKGRDALPDFRDVGFRKYSQFEEDGILLYLFALIGATNRVCVEMCAGSGRECMAANLIINHGWWGHLFDGNEHSVNAGRDFFRRCPDTVCMPPNYTQAWITAENVNTLIQTSGASGTIDLLSLDMDGIDYWVWKAITIIEPRVVVCEVQNFIPGDRSLTIPYDPAFSFESEGFRSASLAAMTRLGAAKGYRLVGVHRYGFNAFFVKNGLREDLLPAVSPIDCLNDPMSTTLRNDQWPKAKLHPWVEV